MEHHMNYMMGTQLISYNILFICHSYYVYFCTKFIADYIYEMLILRNEAYISKHFTRTSMLEFCFRKIKERIRQWNCVIERARGKLYTHASDD